MNCALIIFTKYPIPGRVKTRIGKEIGYESAAELYKNFVADMLGNIDNAGLSPVIAYDPFQPVEKYREWLGERVYIPQQGNDLGERMYNALKNGSKLNVDKCILTGSDLPDLDPEIIIQAVETLKKAPACIGPASDGGYYLVGFKNYYLTDTIFKNMEWSTETVFSETISRLGEQNITPTILPEHQDMDTINDLHRLINSPELAKQCPKTFKLLTTVLQS